MENLLPAAATLLATVSPRATKIVQSTDVPLWALVVIVVGGTVILVTALVLPLICLRRWRRRRRRRLGYRKRTIVIDGSREVSVYGGGPGDSSSGGGSWGSRNGGKLRKKNWAARMREVSATTTASETDRNGSEGGMSGISSVHSHSAINLPPVLPQLFMGGRRFSASVFSLVNGLGKTQSQRESAHSGHPGHRRKTSNAWVDEDALHGPVMNVSPSKKGRKNDNKKSNSKSPSRRSKRARLPSSWRLSFRESWPLKSLSPTLPRLSHFGSPKTGVADLEDTHQPERKADFVVHEDMSMFHCQTHLGSHTAPNLPAPEGGVESQDSALGYSPPRQLPKPPRQALLAASAEVAGTAHERSNSWHGALGPRQTVVPRDQGPGYFVYEDGGTPMGSSSWGPARVSPMSRGRRATLTDSKLTEVLEHTQRRLQEGVLTGTNGWSRSQMSTSPSRRTLEPSAMARERPPPLSIVTAVGNESSATLVGTVSTMTPSPQKRNVNINGNTNKSRHARHNSKDSITSEPDSLLAEQSPVLDHYHGLTSPKSPTKAGLTSVPKKQQQQQQTRMVRSNSLADSFTSSVDDLADDRSLSDIHERNSEESTSAQETWLTSAPRDNTPMGMDKIGGVPRTNNHHDPLDDPFVSLRNSPARSPRLGAVDDHVYPFSNRGSMHDFNDAPRLLTSQFNCSEISLSTLRAEITLPTLRSESPLSAISGNSRSHSPDLLARRNSNDRTSPIAVTARIQAWVTPKHARSQSQPQVQQGSAKGTPITANGPGPTPPPTSAVSSTSNLLHRRQLSTVHDGDEDGENSVMVPDIALTSPSDKDWTSPLTKRVTELIRPRASSPTLGRSREFTPDMPPPSPALPRNTPRFSSVNSDLPATGDNRLSFASDSTTTNLRRTAGEVRKISDDTTTTSSWYSGSDRDATNDFSTLVVPGTKGTGMQPSQTIRLVPREETCLLPVSSTVGQLRRMNSQVAYSYYSDGTSVNNSPVLPTLREEDTGRFVSPPRKREATRNYLALGGTAGSESTSVGRGVGGEGGGRYANNFNDKENEMIGNGLGLKMPKADVGENITLRKGPGRMLDSPTKHLRPPDGSPERKSSESLGLYDRDGFWISPERRAKRQR